MARGSDVDAGRKTTSATVEAVRKFNRFYTREIGVLNEGLLRSPYSLAAVRLMYEIANRGRCTAKALAEELRVDPGYVSRLLAGLRKRGVVATKASEVDRRQQLLRLTAKGRREFAVLDRRAHEEIREKLARLREDEREQLTSALQRVEELLGPPKAPDPRPFVLRPHRAGDMGWVVHRHGVLYAQEYGWDATFEALVAEIAAHFIRHYDSTRERCWIAERGGDIAGSVFLVRKSDRVAKLRMLLVEPSARGLGLGRHLVDECIAFARQAGYRKLELWTNSVLHAARRIYEQTGFRLVEEEPQRIFGHDLVAQTWELIL